MTVVTKVSWKAESEPRHRCAFEYTNTLVGNKLSVGGRIKSSKVVDTFLANRLTLLQAKKEGRFVIVTQSSFSKKASEASSRNFRTEGVISPANVKSATLKLSYELGLGSLRKSLLALKENL